MRREINPIHGVDYLNDHYAILGVERSATTKEITSAYRGKVKEVHPDRLEGLDAQLQANARRKFEILDLAYKTLKNHRSVYDEKLAEFDPDLISESGTPLISLRRRRVDLDFLVGGREWEGKSQLEEHAKVLSGYNETAFEIVKKEYEANPEDEETKKAYKELLERKSAYVSILEDIQWEAAGVNAQPDTKLLTYPDDHLTQRKEQIEGFTTEITERINERVLAITNGEAPLLLTGPEDSYSRENAGDLQEKLTTIALQSFEKHKGNLEALAQERAEVLEQLTNLTEWEYFPEKQPRHNKIMMLVEHGGNILCQFAFEKEGLNMDSIEGVYEDIASGMGVEEIKTSKIKKKIDALVKEGTNVSVLSYNPEFDIKLQLGYVLRKHFGEDENDG